MGNRALTTTYTYDALNRIISAHEVAVSLDTTRTYQYDTLGNLIRQEQDGCEEYKYNGFSLDESKECGVIPGVIGTCRWEYTYDGRGNLISEDKYTRTTTGMDWQNVATYVYDETGRMVEGKNELGEYSLYTYNGLGVRVARELVMVDNTHGYTDFHSETPSVETGLTKAEVVKESYVIDYTSATLNPLTMDEVGGFNYRYVYGLDKLSVKITSEGTTWWGQNTTTNILKDYYHQDRMGSTTNMTDTYGRVVGRADYNEWGQITYRDALNITSSYRRIYPQLNYTGYDWDDVLGMYYAKARFYSADDKRFVAMDPVKGNITEPLSLVSYLYCVDNPLRWVDPLGLKPLDSNASLIALDGNGGGSTDTALPQNTANQTKFNPASSYLTGGGSAPTGMPYAASLQAGIIPAPATGRSNWLTDAIEHFQNVLITTGRTLTDTTRQDDFVRGMIASVVIDMGESGGILLDAIAKAGQTFFLLPDPGISATKELQLLAKAFDEYALSLSLYEDSYYLGRMLGDLIAQGVAMGYTVKAIFEMAAGGGMALGGTVSAGTGIGAAVAVLGVAVTADGVMTVAAGSAIAAAAAANYGSNSDKFDEYFDKVDCKEELQKEFEKKWNDLKERECVKRPESQQPHSNTKIYERNDSLGYETAISDFDSLGLDNVEPRPQLDGHTTYIGRTPGGEVVNLHWSHTEQCFCIQYGNIKIRY